MLKILCQKKSYRSGLLKQWIQECGNSDYSSDGKVIFCQPCGKQIKCFKKFQLTHKSSHIAATKRVHPSTSKQTFLTQNVSSFESNVFFLDLCQALISANIPWNKLIKIKGKPGKV